MRVSGRGNDVLKMSQTMMTTTTTKTTAPAAVTIHLGTIYEILFVQFTDDIIVNQSFFAAKVPTTTSAHIRLNFPSLLLYYFLFSVFFTSMQWHKVTFFACIHSTCTSVPAVSTLLPFPFAVNVIGLEVGKGTWNMMDWMADENNLKMSLIIIIVLDCCFSRVKL